MAFPYPGRPHFGRLERSLRAIAAEARRLRAIEQAGESDATPLVMILAVVIVLLPIVAIVVTATLGTYYLVR